VLRKPGVTDLSTAEWAGSLFRLVSTEFFEVIAVLYLWIPAVSFDCGVGWHTWM